MLNVLLESMSVVLLSRQCCPITKYCLVWIYNIHCKYDLLYWWNDVLNVFCEAFSFLKQTKCRYLPIQLLTVALVYWVVHTLLSVWTGSCVDKNITCVMYISRVEYNGDKILLVVILPHSSRKRKHKDDVEDKEATEKVT